MSINCSFAGRPSRQTWAGGSCVLALLMELVRPQTGQAADHVEFKYELYKEDDHRIEVNTGLFKFEQALTPSTVLKGEMVYDSISGATPTGGPPPPGSNQVPLAPLTETRYAGGLELHQRWGNHTLTPQVAYSTESDYESWGISLKDDISFNNKNTTISVGAAHNFDTILAGNSPYVPSDEVNKRGSTDMLLGVSQLLGPKTILLVNGTYGYANGYLTDPYKGVRFDSVDFDPTFIFGEQRPTYRSREVFYASLTHFITPADASVELAYRFYHDSYDIYANSAILTWYQKVGEHLSIEPSLRYYRQTEASFYYEQVPADLGNPFPFAKTPDTPTIYSADYRLSSLTTWTMGVKVKYKVHEHFSVDATYERYVMLGNDNVTSASAYPKANVLMVGLSIWY